MKIGLVFFMEYIFMFQKILYYLSYVIVYVILIRIIYIQIYAKTGALLNKINLSRQINYSTLN